MKNHLLLDVVELAYKQTFVVVTCSWLMHFQYEMKPQGVTISSYKRQKTSSTPLLKQKRKNMRSSNSRFNFYCRGHILGLYITSSCLHAGLSVQNIHSFHKHFDLSTKEIGLCGM